MHIKLILLSLITMFVTSCDPEPAEPETNCDLNSEYIFGYRSLFASKVFDVSTDPPSEITNGTLEYDLTYQWVFARDQVPVVYPYNEYIGERVSFFNDTTAVITYIKDFERSYTVKRSDCQLDLFSPVDTLHMELFKSGEEISFKRYAIFNHQLIRPQRDSFLFIEFREGNFVSYEEIVKQFALEHPGEYDTIAIELVQNSTRE